MAEPAVGIRAKYEDTSPVVAFVTAGNCDRSEIQIVDAKTSKDGLIARILLPARVPAVFHGKWARGDQIARS